MTLQANGGTVLRCDLVPWSDGVKVRARTPFVSPWRTIQIAESPGDLITSHLILNLNEPSRIPDTSWIRPGKYVGIWWGMHLGIWTWGSGPTHGATTARTRSYIDFAAKHGFDGVLVEGWNVGWDGNWIENGDKFSFTQPYPDFDLEGLARYAADKGVTLIGHHETAFDIDNYERQLKEAFALYERLGVRAVKTGYVVEEPAEEGDGALPVGDGPAHEVDALGAAVGQHQVLVPADRAWVELRDRHGGHLGVRRARGRMQAPCREDEEQGR